MAAKRAPSPSPLPPTPTPNNQASPPTKRRKLNITEPTPAEDSSHHKHPENSPIATSSTTLQADLGPNTSPPPFQRPQEENDDGEEKEKDKDEKEKQAQATRNHKLRASPTGTICPPIVPAGCDGGFAPSVEGPVVWERYRRYWREQERAEELVILDGDDDPEDKERDEGKQKEEDVKNKRRRETGANGGIEEQDVQSKRVDVEITSHDLVPGVETADKYPLDTYLLEMSCGPQPPLPTAEDWEL